MDANAAYGNGAITSLYQRIQHLYSFLPYYLSPTGASLPTWHYYFEVTRRCNLRCKMCQYITWLKTTPAKTQSEGELSTEEWLDVIDQTNRFSLITFTGGEVFVRKDFMTLLERACSKRRVHFISNATMLNEDRARQCVELAPKRFGGRGFNFLGTSIDGTREVHDVIRAQKGAFDKSIRGVSMLAKFRQESGKKAPLIHVNTVIQDENLDCLSQMPAIVAEAGGDVLNLLTEMRSFDDLTVGHVDPGKFSKEDIAQKRIDRRRLDAALNDTFAEAKRHGIEVRMPRMPYEEVLNHYDQGYDLRKFQCRSIWFTLYVGSKGGVYPCFIRKVGNVREKRLKEIWNGPELREFRKRRRQGGFALCRGCCELEYDAKAARRLDAAPAPSKPEDLASAARSKTEVSRPMDAG